MFSFQHQKEEEESSINASILHTMDKVRQIKEFVTKISKLTTALSDNDNDNDNDNEVPELTPTATSRKRLSRDL
jgi:hypothetical protein